MNNPTETIIEEAPPTRTLEEVLASISELARTFLDERRNYGEMRTDIKKRSARARLYIVNNLPEFLNPEAANHLILIGVNKIKLTLDTIDALVALDLGEDYDRYEAAKFNAATSEKAFSMFEAELSGLQSKIKRDVSERDNVEYAQRMTAQKDRPNY